MKRRAVYLLAASMAGLAQAPRVVQLAALAMFSGLFALSLLRYWLVVWRARKVEANPRAYVDEPWVDCDAVLLWEGIGHGGIGRIEYSCHERKGHDGEHAAIGNVSWPQQPVREVIARTSVVPKP